MRKSVAYTAPSNKVSGWHVYTCPHCGFQLHSPYGPERVFCGCLITPEWHEFGAWLEIFLAVIYLDKRRWLWLRGKLGFTKPCGCDERAAKLNTVGARLAAWLQNLRQKLTAIVYNQDKGK